MADSFNKSFKEYHSPAHNVSLDTNKAKIGKSGVMTYFGFIIWTRYVQKLNSFNSRPFYIQANFTSGNTVRSLETYRKYFIVSPASIVSPLESKPAKIIQPN